MTKELFKPYMAFIDLFFKKEETRHKGQTFDQIAEQAENIRNGGFGALHFNGSSNYTSSKALTISAVYRAVEIISDSIAQLPLELYKVDSKGYKRKDRRHPVYSVINAEPNVRMTRYTFIKLLVESMLLRGNAYAYIMREGGEIKQLVYIPSELVTVIPSNYLNEPISYSVVGVDGEVAATDMIHILNFTFDGITGISTLRHAANSLGLAADAENHARGFFSGGCAIGGTLTVASSLTAQQKKSLKESWQQAFSPQTGRPNSVAILEGNMTYQPIGIDPTDSQLLETRQFSVVEVGRWFGVSPVKLFDLTKSSYSTVEATNLSFLTDTIQPILQKFEMEFERKLFTPEEKGKIDVKFDVAQLIRADKQSLAEYYAKLFSIGAMTVNEIRKELDLLPVADGDTPFIQSNLMSVSAVSKNVPANSAIVNDQPTTDQPTEQKI